MEEEIAAKLASQVDPPADPANPIPHQPDPDEQPAEHASDNDPLGLTLDKMKLLDYFGVSQISRHTAETQGWLNQIMDWARAETKSSEYTDLLRIIGDQERIMGIRLRPDRLSRLAQYVKIHTQRQRLIEMERALYE